MVGALYVGVGGWVGGCGSGGGGGRGASLYMQRTRGEVVEVSLVLLRGRMDVSGCLPSPCTQHTDTQTHAPYAPLKTWMTPMAHPWLMSLPAVLLSRPMV